MAGVGFELKKLFKYNGLFAYLKAMSYSTAVAIGPMVLCISVLVLLQLVMQKQKFAYDDRLVVSSTIVYAYFISQVITSGFCMVLSRFTSDKIYLNDKKGVLESYYGAAAICIPICLVSAALLYYKSPLSLTLKAGAYVLMAELSLIWLLGVYITAIKEYSKIFAAYFYGFLGVFLSYYVMLKLFGAMSCGYVIICVDIGFFIIAVILASSVKDYFKTDNLSGKIFAFLKYLDLYPGLFATGLLYCVGLYGHVWVLWLSSHGTSVVQTYRICPAYDVPVFYSFFSFLPSMVFFVVRTETSFFEAYRSYYNSITCGGSYKDIKNARENMEDATWTELKKLGEIQLFCSLIFIWAGIFIWGHYLETGLMNGVYSTLVIGAFGCIMMFVSMLLLLYFDDRLGAFLTAFVFSAGSVLLTHIFLTKGIGFMGTGFFAASFVALLAALIRLSYYLKNIDYYTFCRQPMIKVERKSIFTWLSESLLKY
ncbi:MAG: exopolysaccharide Pel transporter PelG [Clostridia bacterium]|nr:exopolysaccharide Pel transporter PelG [Clostridia bacterium]